MHSSAYRRYSSRVGIPRKRPFGRLDIKLSMGGFVSAHNHNDVSEGYSCPLAAFLLPTCKPRRRPMQEVKTYRQYAADCRRMAKTMSKKDGEILLTMAEAWDGRADEADRRRRKKADGHGEHAGDDN